MHKISYEFKVKYFISFFWYSFAFFKSELRNEMTYDELELDAVLLEVLENRGSFDSMDLRSLKNALYHYLWFSKRLSHNLAKFIN